jgi:hypothetical protein
MRNRKYCLSHLRYRLLFPGTGVLYIAILKVLPVPVPTFLASYLRFCVPYVSRFSYTYGDFKTFM